MKNKRMWAIPIMSMILNVVAVFFLPDEIPIHYDIYGNVDARGTKYTVFIISLLMFMLTILFEGLAKRIKGDIEKNDNDKVIQKKKNLIKNAEYIGLLTEMMLLIMNAVMFVLSYKDETVNGEDEMGFVKVLVIFISILMILLGNYLPKCKRNSVLGIRTKWSLQDDKKWSMMQKVGGRIFAIAGLINVLMARFLSVENLVIFFLIIIAMVILVVLIYPLFLRSEH